MKNQEAKNHHENGHQTKTKAAIMGGHRHSFVTWFILLGLLVFTVLLTGCGKSGNKPQKNGYYNNGQYYNNFWPSGCPYGQNRYNLSGTMEKSGQIYDQIYYTASGNGVTTYQNGNTGNKVILRANGNGGLVVTANVCLATSAQTCTLNFLKITKFDPQQSDTFQGVLEVCCLEGLNTNCPIIYLQ